ncbi:MAG: MATE family efflux transporter [Clostridia bacterium]|nr:MATE family efflux transporter [Clostridia bacterium]
METMDIKKLSLKLSLPMVMSMISIALYGIVDTIFISNISDDALTTVSLCLPIISIITAIGLGTSIGVNSLLARTLGEKKQEKAHKIIVSGIYLIVFSYIIIALVSTLGINLFFKVFTDNINIRSLGFDYLFIIAIFSFGTLFQMLFEKILEAYGKTKDSMLVQFSGALINLVLDPILIFSFNLGIKGASIATVIGQIFGMLIGIALLRKNHIINIFSIKDFKLEKEIIKDIYKVGFPTIILESAESFITLILNKILIDFSESAVSVWGVYCQLQKFVLIIVYGLNYGMIPILAYNLGAKHKERINECLSFFLKLACLVTSVGMLIFFAIPNIIISFFDVSEDVLILGTHAFKILSLGFIFAGISLVFSSSFQAFGKGSYSLIINLSRKIIFVLPLILLLKNILKADSVWVSFTISEILTMIIAIILHKKINNKIIDVI